MKLVHLIFYLGIILLSSACSSKQVVVTGSLNSVIFFGADPTGTKDATAAFQKALNSKAKKITVPEGRYRIDGTVEISQYLLLEAGAYIYKSEKGSNEPIFWLNKSKAVLAGEHKGIVVESKVNSPDGIVRIGHENNSQRPGNILYCSLENLTIRGINNDGSKGVVLYNEQERGNAGVASYFHTLNNLIIEYVETGIHLLKMSNANSISQIYFNRVGRNTEGTAILIEGAMENRIYDCFHHLSPNATTIRIKDYDDLSPVYNYIYGIVAEQGGKDALCLDFENGKHNIIEINCNVLKGMKTNKAFEKQKNVLKRK